MTSSSSPASPVLAWALANGNIKHSELPLTNCWKFAVLVGDDTTHEAIRSSKVRGIPYLPADTTWPICVKCSKPLWFAFQLSASTMPPVFQDAFGRGWLLQHWECLTCVAGHIPQDGNPGYYPRVQRILDEKEGKHGTTSTSSSMPTSVIPPTWSSYGCHEVDDVVAESSYRIQLGAEAQDVPLSANTHPQTGDKLAGFPYFRRRMLTGGYPTCPTCHVPCIPFLQMWCEDLLYPIMLKQEGIGHFFVCTKDVEHVVFDWASL